MEYDESNKIDKKNKNLILDPVIETDPLELAAAQAEVKSVDIDGYLLDDEEQIKRYLQYCIIFFSIMNLSHDILVNLNLPSKIKLKLTD